MIENMQPGRELDALVAERVFGWRRIQGPKFDYDGPVESGEVLIPPTLREDEAYRMMPPKGAIPFFYFVHQRYSTDWNDMRLVVEEMIRRGAEINIGYYFMWDCSIDYKGTNYSYASENAPHATCIAALLALKEEDTNE